MKVEIKEGTLSRPCNTPGRSFGFGAGLEGAHIQVTYSSLIRHVLQYSLLFKGAVTSVEYETFEAEPVCNVIGPHSLWKVPVVANNTKIMRKSKKITNSIQVSICTKVGLRK